MSTPAQPPRVRASPEPPPPSYGLLGQNGCGKTNFLQCLASREVRRARRSCSALP